MGSYSIQSLNGYEFFITEHSTNMFDHVYAGDQCILWIQKIWNKKVSICKSILLKLFVKGQSGQLNEDRLIASLVLICFICTILN